MQFLCLFVAIALVCNYAAADSRLSGAAHFKSKESPLQAFKLPAEVARLPQDHACLTGRPAACASASPETWHPPSAAWPGEPAPPSSAAHPPAAPAAAPTDSAAPAKKGSKKKLIIIIAAVLLLVAIIAAIALTLRERKDTRHIDAAQQVRVKARDRFEVLKMPPTVAAPAPAPAAENTTTEGKA